VVGSALVDAIAGGGLAAGARLLQSLAGAVRTRGAA
jgi:hypothetical protein